MQTKILYVGLAISLLITGGLANKVVQQNNEIAQYKQPSEVASTIEQAGVNQPLVLEVTLQKQYVDGKIAEETHEETIGAMEDFWANYQGWQLIEQETGAMTFRKNVNDISPYLKKYGYFGLQDGKLSIFEGKPTHDQVIQSFYQIDTDMLESMRREELENGIKINSKETYLETLEVYRDLSPTKQVQG
ncbi:hypothetical protein GCM10011351_11660 [Paraliobacillus quinghaiensis]|uniref:Bypass-of-forespore protein C n=1 Tax=Paraliobacillus quinghaiensis TaxID=470815 RepID=A0A917TLZ4_9BACI|nr:BofC C-terminal domain-containing protein [Paraliobacillus quinghaiensis]GGM27455.1 hypothetical protein GCM10011351_11660 [Paraliobacillus quinghaiensis]